MKDPERRNEIVSEAPKGPASPLDQAPPGNARKDAGAPDTGQAAAAAKNRETTVRLQIVEAFQQLGISDREWPDCVRRFYSNPEARKEYIESNDPLPFPPLLSIGCTNLPRSGQRWPTQLGNGTARAS